MGICGCKLPTGLYCKKETVWNDMCEDCLKEYEDDFEFEEKRKESLVEILTKEEKSWDKSLCVKLKDMGLSHDICMRIIGLVAEERMSADLQGYKRGLEEN